MRPLTLLIGALLALAGCSDDPSLSVRLHSDLRPARVRVSLGTFPFETFQENRSFEPGPFDDFLSGVDVANFGQLPSGDYFVSVELRDTADAVTVEQTSLIRLSDTDTLVFAIGASCVGVTCPAIGDSACFAGACVNPACSSFFPSSCAPVCSLDPDCGSAGHCVEGVCLGGEASGTSDAGSAADGGAATSADSGD